MKVVIQRVSSASVSVGGELLSSIGKGLLVLLGIGHEDSSDDIAYLVKKIVNCRIFDDREGVMNRSILEDGGDIIVVSQFTLMASTKRATARLTSRLPGEKRRSHYMKSSAKKSHLPLESLSEPGSSERR